MLIRPLAASVLLASSVAAQIPFDHLLIAEQGAFGGSTSGLVVVNPTDGLEHRLTNVQGGGEFWGVRSVSLDRDDPNRLVFTGNQGFAFSNAMRECTLDGLEFTFSSFTGVSFPVQTKIAPGRGAVYTVAGGTFNGIWLHDLNATNTGPANGLLSNFAEACAVDNDIAYGTSSSGDVVAWNLATNVDALIALNDGVSPISLGSILSIEVFGGSLLLGDASGDIWTVDPTSGVTTLVASTGLNTVTGIAASLVGDIYYAGANGGLHEVHRLGGAGPIYSTTNDIDDLDISWNLDFQIFGQSCAGSSGNPTIRYIDSPIEGTTWNLRLNGAVPFSTATVILAVGQTDLDLSIPPFLMIGCRYYPLIDFFNTARPVNGNGNANFQIPIPAGSGLDGFQVTWQWASLDPGLNPFNLAWSEGANATFR